MNVNVTGFAIFVAIGAFTTIANVCVADSIMALESVAFSVKVKVPVCVGVPLMVPDAPKDSPGGSKPLGIDHVYGAVPPVATSVRL